MKNILSPSTHKICFILPYFGKFPNYFPFFLDSCRYNDSIDWLIITDSDQPYAWPENVTVQHVSFSDIRARFQKSFDFPICLERPIKLCDYKPTYGEIFKEELRGYDFWGHCDCDLIFGNIRHFITDALLEQYDKILSQGHLILYRNTPEINAFYRTQTYQSYKAVFSNPKSCGFDEWPGVSAAWKNEGRPFYGEAVMDDIRVGLAGFRIVQEKWLRQYRKMRHICYFFQNGELDRVWIENGTVHRSPVLYVHFQKRKMLIGDAETGSDYMIARNTFCKPVEPEVHEIRNLTGPDYSPADLKQISKEAVYPAYRFLRDHIKSLH